MAKAREIKNRITGVKKTRKITRTMEMVATSKMQKWQKVVISSRPYSENLEQVLARLASSPEAGRHPLMRKSESMDRVGLMFITSNRGMCGAFNSTIIRRMRELRQQYLRDGAEVDLYALGKKARLFLRHQEIEPYYEDAELVDSCSSEDASKLADSLMDRFLAGEVDRVEVVYTGFLSAGRQEIAVEQLLPIQPPRGPEREQQEIDFIFEPSAGTIIDTLLPMYVQSRVYRMVAENITSEQAARRRAMKQATDNADEMITDLTRKFNRQRQAQITRELSEIVGASEALE